MKTFNQPNKSYFENYKTTNLFTGKKETINLLKILANSKDLKLPTEKELKKIKTT